MEVSTLIKSFVQNFTYGDIVPKEWFYERLGYDYETATAVDAFGYAKDHDFIQRTLREDHHYILVPCAKEKAYRIISKDEYAEYAKRALKNALERAFREHKDILEAAPSNELTDAQIKEITDEKLRASNLKLVLSSR